MNTALLPAIFAIFAAAATTSGDANAACNDRPGTPDAVQAKSYTSASIDFGWRNTTGRGAGPFVPHLPESTMWFDLYLHQNGHPIGRNVTGAGPYRVAYRSRDVWSFDGLAPNTEYCVAIRARTGGGTSGCVSKNESAWACARTLAAGAAPLPRPRPLPSPGSTQAPTTATEACLFTTTVTNSQCTNLDGTPSSIVPGSYVMTACGGTPSSARNRGRQLFANNFACIGEVAGCCGVSAKTVAACGCR